MKPDSPPTAAEPKVAIIILNWNGFDDSVECLRSLRDITYRNHTVVLVDNGSGNSEGTRLKELFPEIHLISNKTNRGFAGGNNDGMNWALQNGFDYIVNLNNDCLVDNKWLTQLLSGLKTYGADFASSRIMYYPETELICSDGDVLLPDGSGIVMNLFKKFDPPGETKTIFSACGAGSIYSARCLEAVKLSGNQFFDELFFAYLEDVDLGARVIAKKFMGISIPDAVVYHKESRSAGARSYLQIFNLEKNRILMELLNFPVYYLPLSEFFYFLRTLVRNVGRIIKKPAGTAARPLEKNRPNPFHVLFTSRMWILSHLPEILANRKERRQKGLIDPAIFKNLCWDLSKIFFSRG
ncbi:glycosyltransferase family 2 protein [Thermodesulfobacteriota bacterium]